MTCSLATNLVCANIAFADGCIRPALTREEQVEMAPRTTIAVLNECVKSTYCPSDGLQYVCTSPALSTFFAGVYLPSAYMWCVLYLQLLRGPGLQWRRSCGHGDRWHTGWRNAAYASQWRAHCQRKQGMHFVFVFFFNNYDTQRLCSSAAARYALLSFQDPLTDDKTFVHPTYDVFFSATEPLYISHIRIASALHLKVPMLAD